MLVKENENTTTKKLDSGFTFNSKRKSLSLLYACCEVKG